MGVKAGDENKDHREQQSDDRATTSGEPPIDLVAGSYGKFAIPGAMTKIDP
jgi:hypothetical protein